MAIFNPNVQVAPDPNYLSYSKPIETPKPDQSLSSALSGFGDVVKSTSTGVDTIFKTDIENQVEAKAQTIKDIFQTTLETGLGKKTADNNVIDTATVASTEVPEDVQDGLDKVAKLKNAKAAKAFPESYYLQRLDTLAKDLRSQYPGYRDFIDKEISSVTGKNMANAYVDNLVAQAKAHGEGKDDDQKAALTRLYPYIGHDGVQERINKILNGVTESGSFLSDAVRTITPIAKLQVDREADKAELGSLKDKREYAAIKADQQIDARTPQYRANFFNSVDEQFGSVSKDANGNPVKSMTLQEIRTRLEDASSGKNPIADEDAQKLGQLAAAKVDNYKNRLLDEWAKDGQLKLLGSKAANEKADAIVKPLADFAALITDNKVGAAFAMKNLTQAAIADQTGKVFNNEKLGNVYRTSAVMNNIGGPNGGAKMIEAMMRATDPTTGRTIDAEMGGYLIDLMGPMVTQPDVRLNGKVHTLNDVVTRAKTDSDATAGRVSIPVVLDQAVKRISRLTDPAVSDTEKYPLAQAISDPGNRPILSQFTMDGKDKNGKYVQGRYIMFSNLVSEDTAKEIKRLSARDPQMWKNYTDNVEHWFGTELFGSDVRALQNVRTDLVRVQWNSETKQFTPEAAEPSTMLGRYGQSNLQDIRLETAKAEGIIQRLNMGLRSLEGFAKATPGMDIEGYLLKSLDQNGFDIAGNVQGIPGRMIRAIRGSVLKTQGKKLQD